MRTGRTGYGSCARAISGNMATAEQAYRNRRRQSSRIALSFTQDSDLDEVRRIGLGAHATPGRLSPPHRFKIVYNRILSAQAPINPLNEALHAISRGGRITLL